MRIRYGKPIKAKSLLGNQFSSLTGDSFSTATTVIMFQNQHYYYGWNWNSFKYNFTLPSHKYFFYAKFKNNLTIRHIIDIGTQNDGSISTHDYYNPSSIIISNERYAIFDNTNSAISRLDNIWFYYNSSYSSEKFNSNIDIPEYWILVDLTDMFGSGKEPTREEFYNKYHQYFPLIATGEEITIDDKAGQISLKKSLPDEYQEVEYVESPDNQYIDTGKTVDSSCIISFDFQYVSITNKYNRIFGARNSNGNALLNMRTMDETGGNFYLESGGSPWADTAVDTNKHSIVMDSPANTMAFDGVNKLSGFRIANNTEGTMWIFGTNQGGSNSNVRFFNYKLIKNGVLEQNLIPCYRKSDNVIGMYDLVGKQFYINQGTGTFLKGPNVNNTISCKVAGGSSDIYYGYNNLCMPLVQDYFYSEYNTEPTAARTYDESNNSTTYMANGRNKNFRLLSTDKNILSVFEGHHYYVRVKMSWNCSNAVITKMGNLNVLTSPGFNIIDYGKPVTNNAYFENIHISKRTGSARWVWSPIIDSGTIQDGDTFTTSDFEIIDLTDWFGAGKEPSTVEEFREKFTKEYYGACLTPIKLTRYQIEALPSYGYNQLGPLWATNTDNGVTATIKNDGKDIELSGTATGWYTKDKNLGQTIPSGHKVLVMSEMINPTGANFGYRLRYNSDTPIYANKEFNKIHTLTGNINKFQLYADLDDNCTGIKLNNLVIIDLTDWYGPGNEPTTTEEFKATFPNKYYPYSKKRLLNKYMINKLEN